MNLANFFLIGICFCSYGLLTWALVKEYATTFPFCLNDDDQERCIPCPDNAKCVETEIQCDERYFYQRGQCLPIHLAETSKHDDLNNKYQKDNPTSKRVFLITIEAIATCSLFLFMLVNLRQINNQKEA